MKTCEQAQECLERMTRGVVGDTDRQAATEHLATCDACRKYQDVLVRSDSVLKAVQAPAQKPGDGGEWGVRLAKRARQHHIALFGSAAAIVAPAVGVNIVFGTLVAGVYLFLALVLIAALAIRHQRTYGWIAAASEKGGDLSEELRMDLMKGIARIRLLGPPLILGGVALAVVVLWTLNEASTRWLFGVRVLEAVSILSLSGLGVYMYFVDLPRLRRELEELS